MPNLVIVRGQRNRERIRWQSTELGQGDGVLRSGERYLDISEAS